MHRSTQENELACRTSSYGRFAGEPERVGAHLAGLGVRLLEIPVPAPGAVGRTLETWARYGLRPRVLEGRLDLAAAPSAREQIEAQCRIASGMAVDRLFLCVQRGALDEARALERLREAGDTADRYGVVLVLQTHPDLVTNGDVGRRTMERLDHPAVRVNFDTGNIHYYNPNVDAVTELEKVLPWIASVHLKETSGQFETWCFPALGEGVVDFPAVFERLAERAFRGPYTIELEGIRGEGATWELLAGRVDRSVRYLRRHGLIGGAP